MTAIDLTPDEQELLEWGDRAPDELDDASRARYWATKQRIGERTRTVRNEPQPADEPISVVDRMRSQLLVGDQILNIPRPSSLIAPRADGVGVLDLETLAVLFGPTGIGKTFVTLSMAAAITTGGAWQGHEVRQAPVLYVIAEGVSGLAPRVTAWQRHEQLYTVAPIVWLPQAVNLLDRVAVGALITLATEIEPALVVVDTLARCMVGADENSAKDIGVVVENLERIRRATSACVLAVHHTGKDETAGARGHSALKGAMDTELELTGDADHLVLTATKQRNSPEGIIGRYRLLPIADSVVLAPATSSAGVSSRDMHALETLASIDTGYGIASTIWRDACDPKVVAARTFYRARKQLIDDALAANVGTDKQPRYSLTDKGRETVDCHAATELPPTAIEPDAVTATLPPPLRGGSNGSSTPDDDLAAAIEDEARHEPIPDEELLG